LCVRLINVNLKERGYRETNEHRSLCYVGPVYWCLMIHLRCRIGNIIRSQSYLNTSFSPAQTIKKYHYRLGAFELDKKLPLERLWLGNLQARGSPRANFSSCGRVFVFERQLSHDIHILTHILTWIICVCLPF